MSDIERCGAKRYHCILVRIFSNCVVAPNYWPLTNGEPCWWWIRSKDYKGYARLNLWSRSDGKPAPQRAARLIVRLVHGRRLTHRMVTRHDCDTPWCVNPAHIRGGTVRQNNRDTADRGRHPRTVARTVGRPMWERIRYPAPPAHSVPDERTYWTLDDEGMGSPSCVP